MEEKDRQQLRQELAGFLNQNLIRILVSNPTKKDGAAKVKVHPVMGKGGLVFQAEEQKGTQAFHKNMEAEECAEYLTGLMEEDFRQLELESGIGQMRALVSKKGILNVKAKRLQTKMDAEPQVLTHNRRKRYILEEGTPVPFLVDLGVMSREGQIVRSRYDKFKQINRFLEFIEDILPKLDRNRENVIVDFGCGKSYLTFAMYYYLHELKQYPVRIIGLDLKQEVIDHCGRLAVNYGYDNLQFYYGDIASYEGVDHVDMVVTLHACDTATDYALEKAVRWGARVILSVPCCQHELNGQISNDLLAPVFQYGLIRERMAALFTDGLRAEILERLGYRTQILEFIDMEHTPKNILIRAVYDGKAKQNEEALQKILEFLNIKPTLYRLLMERENGTDGQSVR